MRIPVSKLFTSDFFSGCRILSGDSGLSKEIVTVNILYNPDNYFYIQPHSLVVIGGHKWLSTVESRKNLFISMVERNVSALGIYLYDYEDVAPGDFLELSEKHGLPVIQLDEGIHYVDIVEFFSENFFIPRLNSFMRIDKIQEDFFHCFTEKQFGCITQKLCYYSGLPVYLRYFSEEVTAGQNRCMSEALKNRCEWSVCNESFLSTPPGEARLITLTCSGEIRYGYGILNQSPSRDFVFWVLLDSPVVDNQIIRLFHFASKSLAQIIQQKVEHLTGKRQKLLMKLIRNEISDSESIKKEASSCFCELMDHLNTVVMSGKDDGLGLISAQTELEFQLKEIAHSLTTAMPLCGIVEDRVVLLISRTEFISQIVSSLRTWLQTKYGVPFFVGISNRGSLLSVSEQFENAQNALRWSFCVHEENMGIVHYQQLGFARLLDSRNIPEIRRYIQEMLRPLFQSERSRRDEYYETLKCFILTNSWNISDTARDLYIHQNTVRYRIQQLGDILNMDLHNSEDRFQLELAIRLNELLAHDS